MTGRRRRRFDGRIVAAALMVGVVGTVLLSAGSAATFGVTAEAENGVPAGRSEPFTSATASGTAAVRFGAGTATGQPPVVRGFMSPSSLSAVTPDTLAAMRSWDANVVRIQLFPRDEAGRLGKPLWEAWPAILDTLDKVVADANAAGLKVVIDLHQGPMPEPVNGGERSTAFWSHPDLESNFVRAWTDIATRLKPRSQGIWGYDLFNEPEDGVSYPNAPPQWRPLAAKLAQTIRAIDPDVWVIFDPGPNAQSIGYRNLTPLPDKKVIYTIHDYIPHEFTHQSLPGWPAVANYPTQTGSVLTDKAERLRRLQPAREFQLTYNVPVFVGEFSVIRWAPKADAVRFLQDSVDIYEAYGWSWTYHAFREWDGWSLEHDEDRANTRPVDYETDRAKAIKPVLRKNP